MSSLIPDSAYDEMFDRGNRAAAGLALDKVSHTAVEDYRVVAYDPVKHTVEVVPLRTGGSPISARVGTDHRGALDGTGSAVAPVVGDHVQLVFVGGSAYGMYSTAVTTGTVFTPLDQRNAPASAAFQQDGTGRVTVYAKPDGGYGTAHHVSDKSVESKTIFGESNIEDWGHEHVIATGENTTRAEAQIREAGAAFKVAGRVLGMRF